MIFNPSISDWLLSQKDTFPNNTPRTIKVSLNVLALRRINYWNCPFIKRNSHYKSPLAHSKIEDSPDHFISPNLCVTQLGWSASARFGGGVPPGAEGGGGGSIISRALIENYHRHPLSIINCTPANQSRWDPTLPNIPIEKKKILSVVNFWGNFFSVKFQKFSFTNFLHY